MSNYRDYNVWKEALLKHLTKYDEYNMTEAIELLTTHRAIVADAWGIGLSPKTLAIKLSKL